MKVEYTSTGMTIDVEATEVEDDSLEIETTDHVDPSNAFACYEEGHRYADCPYKDRTNLKFCTHCGVRDHSLEDCPTIRGNLGSKMGLIRKRAKISFCELEFKNQ